LTGGIILKIVYDYTIDDKDDRFVRNADLAAKSFSKTTSPRWLVDMVPFCASFYCPFLILISLLLALPVRHLPLWTPGATFLRQAKVFRQEVDNMFDEPFDLFTRQMVGKIGSGTGVDVANTLHYHSPENVRPQATTLLNA